MREARVSVDQHSEPGVVHIIVEPGATPLEKALVENLEDRKRLREMNHPKRFGLVSAEERDALRGKLKGAGRRLWAMIERWREG